MIRLVGGLDGEDGGFAYISKALGDKIVVYIGHREMYLQLYMCALRRKGSTYQDSEPMFKHIASSPFSAKRPLNALCRIQIIDMKIQGHVPCCCCCCCWGSCPGLGKTGTVSNCSNPPMVPWPACQLWPVCWFTNADWRKGLVLPVGVATSGEADVNGDVDCVVGVDRAKGLVPVRCGVRGGAAVCCNFGGGETKGGPCGCGGGGEVNGVPCPVDCEENGLFWICPVFWRANGLVD